MSIFIMILLLSLLILVHEAGHFLAARAFGIRVDKFGFGLPVGPTLYKTKIGEVEVLVHALLLGGYVSFPDEKDCDLPEDSPERFVNKPIWQRAIVVSAGVISNVICGIALVMLVAIFSGKLPSGSFEIYADQISAPKEASIWQSGLQSGDRILKANGCDINNVYSLVTIIKNSAKDIGFVTEKTVEKNYAMLKQLNPGLSRDELIPEGIAIRLPEQPAQDKVMLDEFMAKGAKYYKSEGYKVSEEIKKLEKNVDNGKKVYISDGKYSLIDIANAISNELHPVILTVQRGGEIIELKPIYPDSNGVIGVGLAAKQTMVDTKNPISVTKESIVYLWDNTYTMMYSLGQLFTGNIPLKDMHGVVAITKIGGDMIDKSGKSAGILLAALISMNLAILNILPIPALDGGHLMFLIYEKIAGKPLDEKIIEMISTIFFSLLIILMIVVVFNDITLLVRK